MAADLGAIACRAFDVDLIASHQLADGRQPKGLLHHIEGRGIRPLESANGQAHAIDRNAGADTQPALESPRQEQRDPTQPRLIGKRLYAGQSLNDAGEHTGTLAGGVTALSRRPAFARFRSMPFDPQPTLTGELLELRPVRLGDFPALLAAASDPLIWEQHPNHDRYQEAVFRQFFEDAVQSGGALVAIDRASGDVIGSSRYVGCEDGGDEVEVGYTFLTRRYWGGRYNGEMKRLMLGHALQWFRAVVLSIGPDNARSRKAADKIGAVLTGSRRLPNGEERLIYRVFST